MLVMAFVGAAVLAFVSWACLREAQRMSRSFIPDGGGVAVAERPQPDAAPREPAHAEPASSASACVRALEDATVPEADNDAALAAAAALWHVVLQSERV
jgi:hypothetical protein